MKNSNVSKMKKFIVAIIIVMLVISSAGIILSCNYINAKLLKSNVSMAIDIAELMKNNFEITDEEVAYMKSLSFNEMESCDINKRLMDVGSGIELSADISNIYLLAPLQKDEIQYKIDAENADFFNLEEDTPLDGMWLLNGKIENGEFQIAQREDIYRYTALTQEQKTAMETEKEFGEFCSDAWGDFVTGYVPVYTQEGNFAGLLGVDIDPNEYQQSAKEMTFLVIGVFVVFVAVMTVLFLVFYSKYVKERERKYQEKEKKYVDMMDVLTNLEDDGLIAKGRHNLTKDRIQYYYCRQEDGVRTKEGNSYGAAVELLTELVVQPEKAEEIRNKLSRENLIQEFGNGIMEGSIEYKRRKADGTQIWCLLKYSVFENPEDDDIISCMYSYDVTERVIDSQIVSQLGEADCDALGILDVDTHQYQLKNINTAIEGPAVVGYGDFEERVRKRLPKIIVPLECENVIKQFQISNIVDQLKDKKYYYIVYTVINNDNTTRRKRCRFCYLDDTKKLILYCRSDITALYEKEQEQLKQTEHALELARNASEAKTEFFSRMSHDMRTPMNGILGLADLSAEEENVTVLKENISKIRSSGEYLLGLINDTLDFQKIESGKLSLNPQIVETKDVLNGITSMISGSAKEKGIDFVIQNVNAELDWYIKLDPMRMKQIFINLLSNAVKFTPQGGTVELKFECIGREGMISHDLITITDTGIGMSEEFLKNGIFKPFSQENNQVTASYAGTGLGLSIAKKLVELMGGNIRVESEQGVGTTFYVQMDFERVNKEAVIQKVNDKETKKSVISEILKEKNILLAEDHPLNAEIAKKLLQKMGCNITWVQNGQECVNYFLISELNQYDLILMDIRMPIMDGLTAAKEIRSLDRLDAMQIPILAMTANAYEEDVKHSFDAGMNDHITKPIEPLVMYEKIAEALENTSYKNEETNV